MCKGQSALARRLNVHPNVVHEWKVRKRAITPETVAELCEVLHLDGEEARRLAALAVVENPKNAAKAQLLRRAFFVCWALGVASTLPLGHEAQATQTHEAGLRAVDRSKIAAGFRALMARCFAWCARAILPANKHPTCGRIAAAG